MKQQSLLLCLLESRDCLETERLAGERLYKCILLESQWWLVDKLGVSPWKSFGYQIVNAQRAPCSSCKADGLRACLLLGLAQSPGQAQSKGFFAPLTAAPTTVDQKQTLWLENPSPAEASVVPGGYPLYLGEGRRPPQPH